ncbi:hypothetical protein BGI05_03850 [Snodgrassella alvi]|nr:hypothetical protein BGH97_06185 [Snodgrassella alvi]ORF10409.1 hypothetical protein BGI00_09530 [Snodgrassella alvi]ORF16469.1 hypothetical protein BGI02_00380 [Snodgrassella alvi]ORF21682.1 hypothetical protein BGI05_03850 [Snodgrassella alvi]ORF24128.1 hypothetical protein BGI06_07445 [Snodgrassella alvi]
MWRKAISMTFCLMMLYFIIAMIILFKPSTGISVGDFSARMFLDSGLISYYLHKIKNQKLSIFLKDYIK